MARIIITLSTVLFFFLFHQTMSQPEHMSTFCNPIENFTQTSLYEANRDLLLSSLRTRSLLGTYSNATVGLSPNTVHGMFLCRGDTTATSCSDCVQTATIEIATNCSLNTGAVIYYQECMVRYSNVNFFSVLEVRPSIVLYSIRSAPNSDTFNETLAVKFNALILSVSSSSSVPYFVEDQERVTQGTEGSYELESMVQCSPGLDRFNCTVCLRFALLRVSTCCGSPGSAFLFTPKCLLRYQTSALPSPPLSPPPLSPPPPPPPALFLPPPAISQPPPPLVFTRPQDVPSLGGSFSFNVIKGNELYGRIAITMAALVFALVNL
ncbi:unnamed protein product [Eruca vesicaria subsp. sativa]|uniref:Gnk2-homologous domain-containing protein n=1 Tax=Eruca vesicaria subsp. sativa TaxID=29727 RepID=A0ABC8KP39_ERUVS|nr:unnamed protein product [Eruca vesicaria subsp. sativa]